MRMKNDIGRVSMVANESEIPGRARDDGCKADSSVNGAEMPDLVVSPLADKPVGGFEILNRVQDEEILHTFPLLSFLRILEQ
jgi:hypothetical protein